MVAKVADPFSCLMTQIETELDFPFSEEQDKKIRAQILQLIQAAKDDNGKKMLAQVLLGRVKIWEEAGKMSLAAAKALSLLTTAKGDGAAGGAGARVEESDVESKATLFLNPALCRLLPIADHLHLFAVFLQRRVHPHLTFMEAIMGTLLFSDRRAYIESFESAASVKGKERRNTLIEVGKRIYSEMASEGGMGELEGQSERLSLLHFVSLLEKGELEFLDQPIARYLPPTLSKPKEGLPFSGSLSIYKLHECQMSWVSAVVIQYSLYYTDIMEEWMKGLPFVFIPDGDPSKRREESEKYELHKQCILNLLKDRFPVKTQKGLIRHIVKFTKVAQPLFQRYITAFNGLLRYLQKLDEQKMDLYLASCPLPDTPPLRICEQSGYLLTDVPDQLMSYLPSIFAMQNEVLDVALCYAYLPSFLERLAASGWEEPEDFDLIEALQAYRCTVSEDDLRPFPLSLAMMHSGKRLEELKKNRDLLHQQVDGLYKKSKEVYLPGVMNVIELFEDGILKRNKKGGVDYKPIEAPVKKKTASSVEAATVHVAAAAAAAAMAVEEAPFAHHAMPLAPLGALTFTGFYPKRPDLKMNAYAQEMYASGLVYADQLFLLLQRPYRIPPFSSVEEVYQWNVNTAVAIHRMLELMLNSYLVDQDKISTAKAKEELFAILGHSLQMRLFRTAIPLRDSSHLRELFQKVEGVELAVRDMDVKSRKLPEALSCGLSADVSLEQIQRCIQRQTDLGLSALEFVDRLLHYRCENAGPASNRFDAEIDWSSIRSHFALSALCFEPHTKDAKDPVVSSKLLVQLHKVEEVLSHVFRVSGIRPEYEKNSSLLRRLISLIHLLTKADEAKLFTFYASEARFVLRTLMEEVIEQILGSDIDFHKVHDLLTQVSTCLTREELSNEEWEFLLKFKVARNEARYLVVTTPATAAMAAAGGGAAGGAGAREEEFTVVRSAKDLSLEESLDKDLALCSSLLAKIASRI